MKTSQNRLTFELKPYYAYHQHTPRYKRSLPWEVEAIELDASHIYVKSGDRNYSASLFMSGGKLTAVVYRVYESRKDKLVFCGNQGKDYMEHLKRTVLYERLTALFHEFARESTAMRIHAALGVHSPFCTSTCPYPELAAYLKEQHAVCP